MSAIPILKNNDKFKNKLGGSGVNSKESQQFDVKFNANKKH